MPKTYAPQVITLDDLRRLPSQDIAVPQPNDPAFERRILAEGDSWFSIGAFPSSNLLFDLALDTSAIAVNLAYPGDTVERMFTLAGNPDLREMLHDQGYQWHAILLSGGGNDVIDRAGTFIQAATQNANDPASWVDQAQLDQMLLRIKNGYRQIVSLRDEPGSLNPGVPIVTHTYDYPMPRNAPAKFLFAGFRGPWLYPALRNVNAPPQIDFEVAKYVMNALGDALLDLTRGAQALPNFFVVNTRGTLAPADPASNGISNDWMNEIHPSVRGYQKLAKKLSVKLRAVL